jgi:hypothetical protein
MSQSTSLSAFPAESLATRTCGGRLVSAPLKTKLRRCFERIKSSTGPSLAVEFEAQPRIERLVVGLEESPEPGNHCGRLIGSKREFLPIRLGLSDDPDRCADDGGAR